MALNELVNAPVVISLAGRDFQVARLSVSEIWASAENEVISRYHKTVSSIAKNLTGQDKLDYLRDATRHVPSGNELADQRGEWLNSIEGVAYLLQIALQKYNDLTGVSIVDLVIQDPASVEYIINHIVGIKSEDKDKSDDKAPTNDVVDKKK